MAPAPAGSGTEGAVLSSLLAEPRALHGARGQLRRVANFLGRGAVPKDPAPVRIGVLGASKVATYALIWPAKRLPNVEVAAVAARDAARAAAFAKEHGIPAAYGSYQELLDDPSLAAIYVATPNGTHGDHAAAALAAGKHVLCEKPFTANAAEAAEVQRVAAKAGLLCREAFHYKEHPASKAIAQLLQSGSIGQLRELSVVVLIPGWAFGKDDIRFKWSLAGGCMMDAGCYCAHTLRFFPGCSRPVVESASAGKLLDGGRVDGRMSARLRYPPSADSSGVLGAGAVGRLEADLRSGGLWPKTVFQAVGSKGELQIENFIMPVLGHTISLTRSLAGPQQGASGAQQPARGSRTETQQLSVYGSGESNYFYQLQRFVSDLQVLADPAAPKEARAGVRAAMQADARDAQDNMALLDAIYSTAGLPLRQPTHAFVARGSDLLPAAAQAKAQPRSSSG